MKLDDVGCTFKHEFWWQGILLQSQFSLFLCILKPEAYAQKLDRSKTPAQLHIMNWHADYICIIIYIYIYAHIQLMDGMGAFSAFREQIEHLEILMQLFFFIQVGSAMLCHHFFALSCPDKEESPYAMPWRTRIMTFDVNLGIWQESIRFLKQTCCW